MSLKHKAVIDNFSVRQNLSILRGYDKEIPKQLKKEVHEKEKGFKFKMPTQKNNTTPVLEELIDDANDATKELASFVSDEAKNNLKMSS